MLCLEWKPQHGAMLGRPAQELVRGGWFGYKDCCDATPRFG